MAAIAEEQSASTEEVTATVETGAASAKNVADKMPPPLSGEGSDRGQ